MPDLDCLCVNATTKAEFKHNAALIETLRDKLATLCIAPDVYDTGDMSHIQTRLNRCTISIKCTGRFPARTVMKNSMRLTCTFAIPTI